MSLRTRLLLLSGALLILLYLECTSAGYRDVPHRRVKHLTIIKTTKRPGARNSTVKPGPSTTKKPGQSTTMKPGQSTTMKPGQSSTTKPGQSTTMKPGQSSTMKPGQSSTTKKPGSSTTGKPGGTTTEGMGGGSGEVETTTREPGGVVMITKAPPRQFDGFVFMGRDKGMAYYLSEQPMKKIDAVVACETMSERKRSFQLASLTDKKEFRYVTNLLEGAEQPGPYYVAIVIESKNGKELMIADDMFGRQVFPLDDSNPDGIMSMRGKRETPILSYVHRRVNRQSKKHHKGKGSHHASAPETPDVASGADVGGNVTLVTVQDTKYPWISNWDGKPGGGECPSECKPTTCTVNTTECDAKTVECTVTQTKKCTVIEGKGRCAMVCEKCDITSPECYVREPRCVVIKERKCTISPPDCEATQDACIISRPECVSRQPPCNKTANTAPECSLPEKCKTHQAMQCKDVPKPCSEGEKEPCVYKQCEPLEICLTPEYCRFEQIVCPPVETFCPPEIVKCPPPVVTCSEPNITCTDPEVYCPPPTVVCTKPLVNCTAPRISCPNIVTHCPNPDIDCPSPTINCPDPTVFCDQPTIPCPVPPTKWEDCAVECEGSCNCVRIVKSGSEWRKEKCECTENYHFICEGPDLPAGPIVPPGPVIVEPKPTPLPNKPAKKG